VRGNSLGGSSAIATLVACALNRRVEV